MYKPYLYLFLTLSSVIFTSCTKREGEAVLPEKPTTLLEIVDNTDKYPKALREKAQEAIQNRCIVHRFIDGINFNTYGKECIEGKHLFVRTHPTGTAVDTSASVSQEKNQESGFRMEGQLDFKNNIYNSTYKMLENKGDDKKFPFLRNFLPPNKRFLGSLNTEYKIIFKTEGNYLILYKASKNLDDIPYTERTAIEKSEDGKYEKSEDGYYMVPFLGYRIDYCKAKVKLNEYGQETYLHRLQCEPYYYKNAKYIRVDNLGDGEEYAYDEKRKVDLFPANYFEGEWFFSETAIETPNSETHLPPFSAKLVKLVKKTNSLEIINNSGDIREIDKQISGELAVVWLEYEMDRDGQKFKKFGERLHTDKGQDPTKKSYVSIQKPIYITVLEGKKDPSTGETLRDSQGNIIYYFRKIHLNGNISSEIVDFLVTKDYLSITLQITDRDKRFKHKYSLLRKTAVDDSNFVPRKWFKEDYDRHFGVIYTQPQNSKKLGEITQEDIYDDFRMIRFNIYNQKPIKWFFSKNSTQDPYYRDIAKEAVQIYNQAFQFITKDTKLKVKVELIEQEDKDLGDMRYNILNLVKTQESTNNPFYGIAPSYTNPNTGQIIGTTTNVILNNIIETYYLFIRNYTKYEIFQKNTRTIKENKLHVVSPSIRDQIETQCKDDILKHINTQKQKYLKKEITPSSNLGDRELILSCAKKISKQAILKIILHEMLHSFGGAHNFKASVDKDNYYKSLDEIKEIFPHAAAGGAGELISGELPKTSSVMDYTPLNKPALNVLGRYDLALLRFLYLNQIETKAGGFLSLEISKDLYQQKPLSQEILSKKKNYLHCPDYLTKTKPENFLCQQYDYGSTPKEIVELKIQTFKQWFNITRYRYDGIPKPSRFLPNALNIIGFYAHWIQLRDQYLKSIGQMQSTISIISEDQTSIDQYKALIAEGAKNNKEYSSYYEIREPIFQFVMDILYLETMKCEVQDSENNKHLIDLERIKHILTPKLGQDLYVENCHSEQVTQFLTDNKLDLVRQKGIENFENQAYYPNKTSTNDVFPLFLILNNYYLIYQLQSPPMIVMSLAFMLQEPDFFEEYRLKLEKHILDTNSHSTVDLTFLPLLYKYFFGFMQGTLNNANTAEIFQNNKNHLKVVPFTTGTGQNSFYQKVQKALEASIFIEDINIPFLTKAYKNYRESPDRDNKTFQQYILDSPNTIRKTETKSQTSPFAIPFQANSFSAQVILKYNENLKEIKKIKELEKSRELTFLEIIDWKKKEDHNNTLFQIIEMSMIE